MIEIPLTPDKYQAALTKLLNGVPDVREFTVPGPEAPGRIVTSGINLDFTYNGVDTLSVNVDQKYGLTRFASENTIKAHLTDLLTGV